MHLKIGNIMDDDEIVEIIYRALRQMQCDLEDGAIGTVKRDLEILIDKLHYKQL